MTTYYISSTKYNIQSRQTKKNGVVYDVVFRVVTMDGKEKQKRLSGYKTKTAAKEAYAAFTLENCTLLKNNPLKKPKAEEKTFGEWAAEWFTVINAQLKDSTVYTMKKDFDTYVLPAFGDKPMSEITTASLREWQDNLCVTVSEKTGQRLSQSTVVRKRAYLSSFLSWYAERTETENPMKRVKLPRKRSAKAENAIWTREQFEQFLSVVDDPLYRTIFAVLFFTGRRKGEVLALSPKSVQKDKIRFNRNVVVKSLNKGEKSYILDTVKEDKPDFTPICPALKPFIEAYAPPDGDFYFGGDNPVHPNTLSHRYDAYVKKTDLPRIRIHDFRHSFVSMLVHNGANVLIVADIIGDTPEQVMKTYAHLYKQDRERVLNAIK